MTVWLLEIEGHEQRYTREWQEHLPSQLERAAKDRGTREEIRVVSGRLHTQQTTPGAFLNFAATNVFKSSQIETVAQHFQAGEVRSGDTFLVTDAWHPGVIQIRYMSDLLRIPVRIVGLWHAGSYDPADFLGRIEDKRWAAHFERALFYSFDVNCFATNYHIGMFKSVLGIADDSRILRCGWPMEYLPETLRPYGNIRKRKLVLFPHRLAPEKQVDIFRDLATAFPEYEFRVCQDTQLTKAEYHRLLGEAVLVFSASLQETLGIGLYEGMHCGARPFGPDRLSYKELYPGEYLYPSAWTESFAAYQHHRGVLIGALKEALAAAESTGNQLNLQSVSEQVGRKFFSGHRLYDDLL
ncbi:glycosyltransferase family protein [Aurantimonas coralicida]|uniref:hypothetical protein n=1 Tax=Aurantimonas coralicida TaxID=182270 RepID=UPI001D195360|nr:hypothetical protein [Aurantimonas coralicida]MCC4298326.1 hypothetical protein [Aurantimonas coralicida]